MKLRLGAGGATRHGAGGTTTQDLPGDLTGQVVTVDLRHVDPGQDAGATELLSELIARGAARLVVAGTDDARARTLLASAQHNAPPSGLAA
ncbi:hypothetical protein EGT67_06025 [Prescottella agglutinans]|uniref:STAS domain-containing protein n=1 Tax=Prescottella agglutinans TaxID=1644129 RepID=A0A3S3ZXV5_9NOCA|nr:hypothetical protein [Prescottella agglutinans]RVW10703.1 hypothetical protein EGT67_06025 [Prescottella agglutinans]